MMGGKHTDLKEQTPHIYPQNYPHIHLTKLYLYTLPAQKYIEKIRFCGANQEKHLFDGGG